MDNKNLVQARRIYNFYIVKGGSYSNNNAIGIDAKLKRLLGGDDADYSQLDENSDKTAEEIQGYVEERLCEQAIKEARACFQEFKKSSFYSATEMKRKVNMAGALVNFASTDLSALDEAGQKTELEVREEIVTSHKEQCLKNSERIFKKLADFVSKEHLTQDDLEKMGCADLYFGGIADSREIILGFLDLPEFIAENRPFSPEQEMRKSALIDDVVAIHAKACLRSIDLFYSSDSFSRYHVSSRIEVTERLLNAIEMSVLDEASLKRVNSIQNSISTKKAVEVASKKTHAAFQGFLNAGGQFSRDTQAGLERVITDYFEQSTSRLPASKL